MKYSKNQIKKAGRIFKEKLEATDEEIKFAEDILTYWRTIHGQIIINIQDKIYDNAYRIDKNAFVAKRLKRTPSIIAKLKRLNNIQLSTMQDIAGIRVVVSSITKLQRLVKILSSDSDHLELKGIDNYLENPKDSGYRSVHLIYKYISPENSELNGLLVEVQIRTYKQHAWATAVETMGTYLNSNLKFNEGQVKWLKYFSLTSSAFAYMEKTKPVPKYSGLTEIETYQQALYEYRYNKIEDNLTAFSIVSKILCDEKKKDKKYHIVMLDIDNKTVYIDSFKEDELIQANKHYTILEKENENNKNRQIVLVSIDSVNELRSAYPNYFLDTKEFIRNMKLIQQRFYKLKKAHNNV
ncbi:MAG: RelA/SpoT domain-containing protein [Bacteroidales bacterium]|nr:RelA/SpoT domain-containing protein [Bacteroidales bacterium]